jgi:hypothetical protein
MDDDRDARIAQLEAENVVLRGREAATVEALRMIASSTEVGVVLESIVASATRLSDSSYGSVGIIVGDEYRILAAVGAGSGQAAVGHVSAISSSRPAGRALLERRTIHIPDRSSPACTGVRSTSTTTPMGSSTSVPRSCPTGASSRRYGQRR